VEIENLSYRFSQRRPTRPGSVALVPCQV